MVAASPVTGIDLARVYPLEQEVMLALPLGYEPETATPSPRIAVFLHAFHMALMPEFRVYLAHLPPPADLFLSTNNEEKRHELVNLFADWPQGKVTVIVTPNRGRDIAPKLVGFGHAHAGYDLVLHLHTKHSGHESGLGGWRGYLLKTLLGSPETVRSVLEIFRQSPGLGLLAPQHIDQLRPWIRWGENYAQAAKLAERMGFPLPRRAPLDFPSGSMFWARPAALAPLIDLDLRFEDFPEERRQTDGTLAHAVERLYFFACEAAGLDWIKVASPGALHEEAGLQEAHSPAALRRMLNRTRLRLQTQRDSRRPFTDQPIIPFFPPRPKRLSYLPWKNVLGDETKPVTGRSAILLCEDRTYGALMRACGEHFAKGADLVLLMQAPGLLHPRSVTALLRMARAQNGCALLAPALLPPLQPQRVDAESFAVECGALSALALPRAAYEAMVRIDAASEGETALQALVARARATALPLLLCPDALIFPDDAAPATQESCTEPGLDILIRLEDEVDLPLAERSLFTILGQHLDRPVTVHHLLTRFPLAGLRALRARAEGLRPLNPNLRVQLHNWNEAEPFDVRAALLNHGLAESEGRYVMVLDVADLLYPRALARLLTRLSMTQAAVTLGTLQRMPVLWWGETVLPRVAQNDDTRQVFMLDRHRLPPQSLLFQRSADGTEIADFITRIRAEHPVDEAEAGVPLGLWHAPL